MRYVPFIILCFISSYAFSQSKYNENAQEPNPFGLEVLKIIKSNSLFSDSLDWKQIFNELAAFPLQKNDSLDRLTILNFFINKL
jgi:hypothetical protein